MIGTWVWHWPPLYDLALRNDAIHDWCEHLTFQAVSVLFWTQVIPSPPLQPCKSYIGRIGCIGVAIVQNLVLAILIAFAQAPLYAPYAQLGTVVRWIICIARSAIWRRYHVDIWRPPFRDYFLHRSTSFVLAFRMPDDERGEVNAVEKQSA